MKLLYIVNETNCSATVLKIINERSFLKITLTKYLRRWNQIYLSAKYRSATVTCDTRERGMGVRAWWQSRLFQKHIRVILLYISLNMRRVNKKKAFFFVVRKCQRSNKYLRLSLRAFQIVSNVRAFTAAWSLLTCKATGERTSRSRELFLHRPYLHIGVLPRGGLLADEKKK